jgi:hypothetical protein
MHICLALHRGKPSLLPQVQLSGIISQLFQSLLLFFFFSIVSAGLYSLEHFS